MTTTKSEARRYRATVERDERFWFIDVPDVPGAHAQVRRLEDAKSEVRDAIALFLDVPAAEVEPVLEYRLGEADPHVRAAQSWRAQADFSGRLASAEQRLAAAMLTKDGITVRDVGAILGLSHQRVAQLLEDADIGELAARVTSIEEEVARRKAEDPDAEWGPTFRIVRKEA